MTVHVGEIHSELSAHGSTSPAPADASGRPGEQRPGAREDHWREARAHVREREQRTCTEDFDA